MNSIYSGMSFQDLMVRQGVLEHGPKTPIVMGFECAGEVEALGENTSGFNVSVLFKIHVRLSKRCAYNKWDFLTHFKGGGI